MPGPRSTLGILVTAPVQDPAFQRFLDRVVQALQNGQAVYSYLIHDAVEGIHHPQVQKLKEEGLILHACALAADRRQIPNSDQAVFSGLGTLGELIARCDEFQTFSPASLP